MLVTPPCAHATLVMIALLFGGYLKQKLWGLPLSVGNWLGCLGWLLKYQNIWLSKSMRKGSKLFWRCLGVKSLSIKHEIAGGCLSSCSPGVGLQEGFVQPWSPLQFLVGVLLVVWTRQSYFCCNSAPCFLSPPFLLVPLLSCWTSYPCCKSLAEIC